MEFGFPWICEETSTDIRIRIPAIIIRIVGLRPAIRPIIPITARVECILQLTNL
jgi:hypothetical protein